MKASKSVAHVEKQSSSSLAIVVVVVVAAAAEVWARVGLEGSVVKSCFIRAKAARGSLKARRTT